jgi:hypothetical protein
MAGDFGRPAAKAREHVPRGPARAEPQPRREPDEIQIHIGRIEVIAAAPAPRAAAAQGRPKATPLEEYLRGRDRRAS